MDSQIVLETEALSKHWGGIKALNDVSLRFHDKQIHGIVGPNGAGKSTLLNMLSGILCPTSGVIFHRGQKVDKIRPWEFVRRGIGRSFQKTNIFPTLTCLENCCVAAQRRFGGSFNFFSRKNSNQLVTESALKNLEAVNLESRADIMAAEISYGEQRQLEIAMVLATSPSILLLDEPLAGMGHEESREITKLLKQLKDRYCIVLVEHDMEAIFELSDLLTVLDNGTHLITGTVDQVRNNDKVKQAYLGCDEEDTL
ncbi:MAG: ABC transporter ATP-binding protein [Gammaproteobacteria bacterium]|nr:ABC transporter ATP-binding protein [Gammaproteobacteria bacterium]